MILLPLHDSILLNVECRPTCLSQTSSLVWKHLCRRHMGVVFWLRAVFVENQQQSLLKRINQRRNELIDIGKGILLFTHDCCRLMIESCWRMTENKRLYSKDYKDNKMVNFSVSLFMHHTLWFKIAMFPSSFSPAASTNGSNEAERAPSIQVTSDFASIPSSFLLLAASEGMRMRCP